MASLLISAARAIHLRNRMKWLAVLYWKVSEKVGRLASASLNERSLNPFTVSISHCPQREQA
jgi:hypothetical protein